MDVVVGKLVEKKSLTKQEFFNLVELHGSVEAPPPNILDIRILRYFGGGAVGGQCYCINLKIVGI
ncbi:hypothetical protein PHJA_002438500 [Phtheirospermum japonicum]|uniref:Uncharacterized protein n=1 Tax=Phtheirospermum japonicum TaxID=374723 RepID=A0A830CUV6_9LAMI|nr:hypothetical protein PHJA_002438500 [Phtheirospermum japonicum]